jgi:hypothetical protein
MEREATHSDDESFSFGLAELRRAAALRSSASPAPAPVSAAAARDPRARTQARPLDVMKPQVAGFDPYNSTGGFDRHSAWSRIRKR